MIEADVNIFKSQAYIVSNQPFYSSLTVSSASGFHL